MLDEPQYLISNYTTRSIVTKTRRYWHKAKQVDQQNGVEDPQIKPYYYSHLGFTKKTKHGLEKGASSNSTGETGWR